MQSVKTPTDLVEYFNEVTTPCMASMVVRTAVKMNKKDVATKKIANPFTEVFKTQFVEVELNANYEQEVNEQRIVEGKTADFKAAARSWGEHINSSIITHNGVLYLTGVEKSKKTISYTLEDGTEVDIEELKPFLPIPSGSVKQELEHEIKSRTYKLDGIQTLQIEGQLSYFSQVE